MLDVSEQGLRFRATTPMECSGPIHFSFTFQSNPVVGFGELVWIDQAKKTGGLRFTDLPYWALEQIRKWPDNSDLRPSIGKDLTLHISALDESPSSSTNERGTIAAFLSRIASVLARLLPASFGSKVPESWPPALSNASAKLRAPSLEAHSQRDNRWLFRASYALFLGIVIATLVHVRHRETGQLLIRLGMKLSGGVNAPMPALPGASLGSRVGDASAYKSSEADAPAAQAVPPFVSADTRKTIEEISVGTAVPRAPETASQLLKPEAPGTQLVVQVAALNDEMEARKLTDKLRQENFQAFVGTLQVDSFYRVMLGPYADETSARIVLGKLKRAGFNCFLRRDSVAERVGS